MIIGRIPIMALKALELQGEVITTPFTFPATVHVLEWLGLAPVFCDIDQKSMCIDAGKIEGLITEKTSAILGVHVYGMSCDVVKIGKIELISLGFIRKIKIVGMVELESTKGSEQI